MTNVFGPLATPIGILLMILAINLIILFHELGHFLAAKRLGLPVEKFAIGFGPSLIKWKRKETEYSLNIILLGGYVAFPVDDPKVPIDPNDKTKLVNRTIPERALVMGAGVIGNFVLAYLVLLLSVSIIGLSNYSEKILIERPLPNSPAQKAGFLPQDQVLRIGDTLINNYNELRIALKYKVGKSIDVTVLRQGKEVVLQAVPDASGKLGFMVKREVVEITRKYPQNPFETVVFASQELGRLTQVTLQGLWMLAIGIFGIQDLNSVVMVVAVGQDVVKENIGNLPMMIAIVSIGIALINILPLPALDGGRLLFLAIEAVIRRPVPPAFEEMVHRVGLSLLLVLSVFIILKDIYLLLKIGQSP